MATPAWAADDTTPPQITALSLTPSEFDTELGEQTLTLTVTLTDEQAGVASSGDWSVTGDGSGAWLTPLIGSQWTHFSLTRVSGDDHDGVYTGTAVLPQGSKEGIWSITELDLVDKLGNKAVLDLADLEAEWGVGCASTTNAAAASDTTPPQITALSLTPSEFDTELGEQTLTLTVTLTDEQAGVASSGDWSVTGDGSGAWLTPLIGSQWTHFSLTRVSGDDHDGVYTGTAVLPQGSKEGIWSITELDLVDKLGNKAVLDADELNVLLPLAEGITIANTATAQQVTIDREWTISSPRTTVTFPADTVVSRQDDGLFAFYRMTSDEFVLDGSIPTANLDGEPVVTLRLGIPGLNLSFSRPVTVSMEVGSAYEGQTLLIHSLTEGGDAWVNETTCVVADGRCTFTVDHATRFIASAASSPDPIFFVGGVAPIDSDGSSIFQLRRTIPLKLHLTDASGRAVTDLSPRLYLSKLSGSVWGTELETLAANQPDVGNLFRLVGDTYMFNLSTRPLSTGTWRLRIDLGNGQETTAAFSLR